jgi:hypothetical protein
MSDYLVNPIGRLQGREIGQGGSSQVQLVQNPTTGKWIAVKYFCSPNFGTKSFTQEIESLAAVDHFCLLQIVHWALPEPSRSGEIHTEYAKRGSLADVLQRTRSELEKGFWAATKLGILICDILHQPID